MPLLASAALILDGSLRVLDGSLRVLDGSLRAWGCVLIASLDPLVRLCLKDESAIGSVTSRLPRAKQHSAQRHERRLVDVDVNLGDARVFDRQADHPDEFSLREREHRWAVVRWLRHQDKTRPRPEPDEVARNPVGPAHDKAFAHVHFTGRVW